MLDEFILQMHNIEKDYDGNKVLKGININLHKGEVLSLVGENGAGKSTLMNILFGMPSIWNSGGFSGEIIFDGKKREIHSPHEAMKLGIGMVHQEFMLLPDFTITENIKLNRENLKAGFLTPVFGHYMSELDWPKMKSDARRALDRIGLDLNENQLVAGLPVGYMQFIEIAREIDKTGMKVIVFDEPTAVLTEIESERLLDIIKKITSAGVAVIFISHKLDEVLKISDTILVMRDGMEIATLPANNTTVVQLAEMMVGHDVESGAITEARNVDDRENIMSIHNLKVDMPGENVKNLNLDIKRGEILGIGGLAGQGKIGISNGILGLYHAEGEVAYNGEKLPLNDPLDVLKKNIVFVSEDRRNIGLIMTESIAENIAIGAIRVQDKFLKHERFFTQIDNKAIERNAEQMVSDFQIKCVNVKQHVGSLSGGNQQKVCLAKALTMNPDVLFVSEPTRGIDIGAKRVILERLVRLNRDQGVTIVVTSSELNELRSICDRIAIITNGKLEGILSPSDSNAKFGLMMSGTSIKETMA